MQEHANSLEQILEILKDSNGLTNICPYSSLINITPDDEVLKYMNEHVKKQSLKSENIKDHNYSGLSRII